MLAHVSMSWVNSDCESPSGPYIKRERQRDKAALSNTYQSAHSQEGNTWQILTPSKRLWAVRGNSYTDRIPRMAVCRKITQRL